MSNMKIFAQTVSVDRVSVCKQSCFRARSENPTTVGKDKYRMLATQF